jgi:NAD+ synthase (glutamine-hydrolysing)
MAVSHRSGAIVLTTGNGSELAVGDCTLYGDMVGGLAAISDVPKTMVYRLAEYINRDTERIPRASIEKPPSAELRPHQTDQDSLPPYAELDPILESYVEDHLSPQEIAADGYDANVVERVGVGEPRRIQTPPSGAGVDLDAQSVRRRVPLASRVEEGGTR